MSELPIGILDSGVGGLTILQEVIRQLPMEHTIYFGDTARLPYGNKSPEAVLRYTLKNVSILLEKKIKYLIIACFTASSHALKTLEQKLSLPVIGMIESGLEELLAATQNHRVAILGTEGTIKSGVFQLSIAKQDPKMVVFPVACPLFVPFIEEGLSTHPAMRLMMDHYLDFLKDKGVDAVLLACTHYPIVKTMIQEVLGPHVKLIEPARSCVLKVCSSLREKNLLRSQQEQPRREFYVSDNPEKFSALANLFFDVEKNKN